MLGDTFFEFAERDAWEAGSPEMFSVGELETGRDYYVVVTTPDGLYRYDMSDIVRVTGWVGATPALVFVQKGSGITSITGEKLHEAQVLDAVPAALGEHGVMADFFIMLADVEAACYTLYAEARATPASPTGGRERALAAPDPSAADRGPRVRIDANNLWRSADACIGHIGGLGRDVFAVEEPLQAGDLDGFRRVADECSTRIVLDESLLRAGQLDAVAGDPARWIANVRVSKMGGVIRSLDVAGRAAELGLGVIVGCQVGETSVLARAALAVMQAVGPSLLAAEGAFGTHLLHHDLASPCIMFGPAGVLAATEAVDTGRGGFGLAIDERAEPGLDRLDRRP